MPRAQAGIVPDNLLHFLHPWRSDGLSVSREGMPGAAMHRPEIMGLNKAALDLYNDFLVKPAKIEFRLDLFGFDLCWHERGKFITP